MLNMKRALVSLGLCSSLLGACQAGPKPQDEAVEQIGVTAATTNSGNPADTRADASEGVVGPDEAFFAAYYLEQVFRYSQENPSPNLESATSLAAAPQALSAFDFNANFTDSRMDLMIRTLFTQGDSDGDAALSAAEFANLKLDPAVLGVRSEKIAHAYDQAFFQRLAGDDDLLQGEECAAFLQKIGPSIKAMMDKKPAQDQMRVLVKSWEKVLSGYDADHSGALSLQEQRDLRQDRARLVKGLAQ